MPAFRTASRVEPGKIVLAYSTIHDRSVAIAAEWPHRRGTLATSCSAAQNDNPRALRHGGYANRGAGVVQQRAFQSRRDRTPGCRRPATCGACPSYARGLCTWNQRPGDSAAETGNKNLLTIARLSVQCADWTQKVQTGKPCRPPIGATRRAVGRQAIHAEGDGGWCDDLLVTAPEAPQQNAVLREGETPVLHSSFETQGCRERRTPSSHLLCEKSEQQGTT